MQWKAVLGQAGLGSQGEVLRFYSQVRGGSTVSGGAALE